MKTNSYFKVNLRKLRALGERLDPSPQCAVYPFDAYDRDSVIRAWADAIETCAANGLDPKRALSVWHPSPLPGPWIGVSRVGVEREGIVEMLKEVG